MIAIQPFFYLQFFCCAIVLNTYSKMFSFLNTFFFAKSCTGKTFWNQNSIKCYRWEIIEGQLFGDTLYFPNPFCYEVHPGVST